MKIIYTAGPITPHDGSDDCWWTNVTRARALARVLWRRGWAVICPQMNTMAMDGCDIPAETFYNGDNEIIARCVDAMLMLPGWEKSKGSKHEEELAKRLGIKVYYDITQVPNESEGTTSTRTVPASERPSADAA